MSQSKQPSASKLEADLELFAPSRSRGGASKALREHLSNLEAELEELRAERQELEEAIIQEPNRALEEVLYPRNELGSQRGEIRRGISAESRARARGREKARASFPSSSKNQSVLELSREFLKGLPWGQILGLLVLIVAVLWLIRVIW